MSAKTERLPGGAPGLTTRGYRPSTARPALFGGGGPVRPRARCGTPLARHVPSLTTTAGWGAESPAPSPPPRPVLANSAAFFAADPGGRRGSQRPRPIGTSGRADTLEGIRRGVRKVSEEYLLGYCTALPTVED